MRACWAKIYGEVCTPYGTPSTSKPPFRRFHTRRNDPQRRETPPRSDGHLGNSGGSGNSGRPTPESWIREHRRAGTGWEATRVSLKDGRLVGWTMIRYLP